MMATLFQESQEGGKAKDPDLSRLPVQATNAPSAQNEILYGITMLCDRRTWWGRFHVIFRHTIKSLVADLSLGKAKSLSGILDACPLAQIN